MSSRLVFHLVSAAVLGAASRVVAGLVAAEPVHAGLWVRWLIGLPLPLGSWETPAEVMHLLVWTAVSSVHYWAVLVLASAAVRCIFGQSPRGRSAERAFESAVTQFHSN